eukprot:GFUD01022514.1.p1 GENE.GFUD01022514.1~~GFUD01022514.1.p1  ORF type:complete len:259 (+),score=64.77 GFUD01022514.1:55-831(+)
MEVESEIDAILQSIRFLFVENMDTKKERRFQLLVGDFFPIPSLRSLAFQSLLITAFPADQFLPGEGYNGYEDDARNLRLLTRGCVGVYRLVSIEDSMVYVDKTEASDDEKKDFRESALNGPVEVLKPSAKEWEVGGLRYFNPAGCLRHACKCVASGDSELVQMWVEENTLVLDHFMEWDYSEEMDSDEDGNVDGENNVMEENGDGIGEKGKFGLKTRVLITFFENQFVYQERSVNTRKCKNCTGCSYEYKAEAWYAKM